MSRLRGTLKPQYGAGDVPDVPDVPPFERGVSMSPSGRARALADARHVHPLLFGVTSGTSGTLAVTSCVFRCPTCVPPTGTSGTWFMTTPRAAPSGASHTARLRDRRHGPSRRHASMTARYTSNALSASSRRSERRLSRSRRSCFHLQPRVPVIRWVGVVVELQVVAARVIGTPAVCGSVRPATFG